MCFFPNKTLDPDHEISGYPGTASQNRGLQGLYLMQLSRLERYHGDGKDENPQEENNGKKKDHSGQEEGRHPEKDRSQKKIYRRKTSVRCQQPASPR